MGTLCGGSPSLEKQQTSNTDERPHTMPLESTTRQVTIRNQDPAWQENTVNPALSKTGDRVPPPPLEKLLGEDVIRYNISPYMQSHERFILCGVNRFWNRIFRYTKIDLKHNHRSSAYFWMDNFQQYYNKNRGKHLSLTGTKFTQLSLSEKRELLYFLIYYDTFWLFGPKQDSRLQQLEIQLNIHTNHSRQSSHNNIKSPGTPRRSSRSISRSKSKHSRKSDSQPGSPRVESVKNVVRKLSARLHVKSVTGEDDFHPDPESSMPSSQETTPALETDADMLSKQPSTSRSSTFAADLIQAIHVPKPNEIVPRDKVATDWALDKFKENLRLELTAADVQILGHICLYNNNIRALDLSNNAAQFGKSERRWVCNFLYYSSRNEDTGILIREHISLRNTSNNVHMWCSIKELILTNDDLDNHFIKSMSNAISGRVAPLGLEVLSLNRNPKLGDKHIENLFDAIGMKCPKLWRLNLSRTGVGNGTCKALANYFKRYCSHNVRGTIYNPGDNKKIYSGSAISSWDSETSQRCGLYHIDLHNNWNVDETGVTMLNELFSANDQMLTSCEIVISGCDVKVPNMPWDLRIQNTDRAERLHFNANSESDDEQK